MIFAQMRLAIQPSQDLCHRASGALQSDRKYHVEPGEKRSPFLSATESNKFLDPLESLGNSGSAPLLFSLTISSPHRKPLEEGSDRGHGGRWAVSLSGNALTPIHHR